MSANVESEAVKDIMGVTIAIPAHNEEDGIAAILSAALTQDRRGYVLERIVVILDGCTDRTEEIVKRISRENPIVELACDGRRLGKSARMNEMFRLNRSDALVVIDADLAFAPDLVAELVAPFSDDQVGVVAANNRPALPPRTVLERLLIARDAWWYDVRHDFNGGDNPDNSPGQCYAFSRKFAETLVFPDGLMHDHEFIYLMSMEFGMKFIFAERAKVIYREVTNWKELVVRARRHAHVDAVDMARFHFDKKDIPVIPTGRKLVGIVRMFFREPIPVAFGVMLLIAAIKIAVMMGDDNPIHSQGLWERSESTKHA
ncbi:MAG: glycosyltransferase [Candidatus Moranbacteria bacterium]|nr:glycosyltransferase [Candidatus Moranbacteria bacterium]